MLEHIVKILTSNWREYNFIGKNSPIRLTREELLSNNIELPKRLLRQIEFGLTSSEFMSNQCWTWHATYRNFQPKYDRGEIDICLDLGRKTLNPARVAYALQYGVVEKCFLRHLCIGNTLCVNPSHLTPGTQTDNKRDEKHVADVRAVIGGGPFTGNTGTPFELWEGWGLRELEKVYETYRKNRDPEVLAIADAIAREEDHV